MGATTGLVTMGAYAGAATNKARVDVLLALLPDPDTTSSSGASQPAGHGYFDEISPIALAQLRAELVAMKANIANV